MNVPCSWKCFICVGFKLTGIYEMLHVCCFVVQNQSDESECIHNGRSIVLEGGLTGIIRYRARQNYIYIVGQAGLSYRNGIILGSNILTIIN